MRTKTLLRSIGIVGDPGDWVEGERVLACRYPRRVSELAALARLGIVLLVNLHERGHDPSRLARYGLGEMRLPVRDFSAPTLGQLEEGVAAIVQATAAGRRVAVHCGAGLGRTGTLLACYLVHRGRSAEAAVERIRAVRPGSVETAGQVAAVEAYARRHHRS